jgi:hypothetical protein
MSLTARERPATTPAQVSHFLRAVSTAVCTQSDTNHECTKATILKLRCPWADTIHFSPWTVSTIP